MLTKNDLYLIISDHIGAYMPSLASLSILKMKQASADCECADHVLVMILIFSTLAASEIPKIELQRLG